MFSMYENKDFCELHLWLKKKINDPRITNGKNNPHTASDEYFANSDSVCFKKYLIISPTKKDNSQQNVISVSNHSHCKFRISHFLGTLAVVTCQIQLILIF